MSSIPLAALAVQPPQDPTQGLQRAITLRNLLQNQPLELQQRQQAVQSGQLQIQQQQQQLKDQQAVTAAWKNYDPSKQKPEDLIKGVLDNGGSGAAANQLDQMMMARQQQFMALDKDAFELQQKRSDRMLGRFDAAKNVSDDQLASHVTSAIQESVAAGDLKPQEAQQAYQVFQQAQGNPTAIRDALDTFEKSHMLGSQIASRAKEQAETQKNIAQTAEAQSTTAKNQMEVAAGGTGAMADSRYRNILMKPAAQRTAEDTAFLKAYEKQKTLVPTAQINLQGGLLSPQAQQMAADYYAQTGQLPAGMRSPAMSAKILNQAAGTPGTTAPDIAANKRTYAVGTALEKAYTSGSQGQQLTAINIAREHMKTFKDTADALNNGNVLLANRVGNWLGTQFGSDKATNFNVARTAFAGEVGKAFAGASVGVADRQELIDKINQASSWDQLKGYADTADKLLEGKQKSLKESYQQGMQGNPNFGNQSQSSTQAATKTYQGHTYTQQPDGSWKLTQ